MSAVLAYSELEDELEEAERRFGWWVVAVFFAALAACLFEAVTGWGLWMAPKEASPLAPASVSASPAPAPPGLGPFVAPTVTAGHRTQEGDFRGMLRRDGITLNAGLPDGTEETDAHNVCGDLTRNGLSPAALAARIEVERVNGHVLKLDPAH